MADIVVEYTLTTPAGTITFNDGTLEDSVDKYWLESVQGLDGPILRVPVDPVPFGNGFIVHTSWKGGRRIILDGRYLILSSNSQADCQPLRNALHFPLLAALNSIIAPTSGTLAWTAQGQGALSITVFYEVGLVAPLTDNFMSQNFSFALISEEADP